MKSELVIVKGQEFKISVQDTIKEDDIFIEQYKQAADMLDAILSENQDLDKNKNNTIHSWQQTEYENNIIAFCGERGDGKSSAMLTFINALCCRKKKKNKDNLFENCENIQDVEIAEPIVIDPSQFDDVHNVLDIVLAKMYKNFNDKYKNPNKNPNEGQDESTVQKLLDQFQTVYRQLAMVYNQKKMLDDEFDYEGNIGKLANLGESTNLKKDFENLIKEYLEFMSDETGTSNHQLLIAIDDLDLCNQVAYKLAEQIRKYLIIPHVVIIMAVKIEQLELAIQEKNINEYRGLMQYVGKSYNKGIGNELNNEIKNMAERYVSKLIPKARRIYMPDMQRKEKMQIIYKDTPDANEENIWESKEKSLVKSVLELIYLKTGMVFLEEETGISYLVPNNLRDLVNWITQLAKMESVEKQSENQNNQKNDDNNEEKDKKEEDKKENTEKDQKEKIEKNKKKNIEKFYQIFKRDWMNRELPLEWKRHFDTLESMDAFHINVYAKKMIESLFEENAVDNDISDQMLKRSSEERKIEFFEIMSYFERYSDNIFNVEREKILYAIKCIYTFKFNQAQLDNDLLKPDGYINGYIWGEAFKNTIPSIAKKDGQPYVVERSRFLLRPQIEYNMILESYFKEGIQIDEQKLRASNITDKNREKYIKCWLILGLLGNAYDGENPPVIKKLSKATIVADNSNWVKCVEISLENYIVSLGDIDALFDKINFEKVGVKREDNDYREIVNKIKSNNEKSILCAKKIASNVDLAMRIRKYCFKNNDYKGKNERSKKLAEVFLKNIADFMKIYVGVEIESDDLQYFKFDKNDKVDISELYALLIENILKQVKELTKKFEEKITVGSSDCNHKIQKLPAYLRNTSAENVKSNLEKLADNIQYYRVLNNKLPENLDVDELCDYYSRVIRLYMSGENMKLSKDMNDKYKELATIQDAIEKDLK